MPPIWFAAVAATISLRVDQAMLRVLLDAEATGVYSAAARISEFWCFIPIAVVTNIVPSLTRMFETDARVYKQNVLKACSLLTAFSFAAATSASQTGMADVPQEAPDANSASLGTWHGAYKR